MNRKVKSNISKTYLLPLLSEFINIDRKYIGHIKNTYVYDSENRYHDCIYILHDFDASDKNFPAYEHELTNNDLFVNSYEVGNQVLYIFKFPFEYIMEYSSYKESKYSRFGKDAKEIILEFWGKTYKKVPNAVKFLTIIKNILYKEKQYKNKLENKLSSKYHKVIIKDDAELGELINKDRETFNFELTKQEQHES